MKWTDFGARQYGLTNIKVLDLLSNRYLQIRFYSVREAQFFIDTRYKYHERAYYEVCVEGESNETS